MTAQTITLTLVGITVTISVTSDTTAAAPVTDTPVTPFVTGTRIAVTDSSVIASIGYNVIHRTLEIEFVSGAVWQYDNVSSSVYDDLITAPSKGRYFTRYIRDNVLYSARKISR